MQILYSQKISRIPNTTLTIACPKLWVSHFEKELPKNIQVISIGNYDSKSRFSWLRIKGIRELIRNLQPDVVHTNEAKTRFYVGLLRRMKLLTLNFNHVHMQHIKEVWRKNYLLDRIISGSKPDLWIAVSTSVRDYLITRLGAEPSRINLIPNYLAIASSLDTNTLYSNFRQQVRVSSDEVIFLAAGRLDYQKGFDILIKAVEFAVSKNVKFRVFIAGDGSERNKLEHLIEQRNLNKYICLLGWREDLRLILQSVDVFVLSSRWEGMPLILAEAVMVGVPVIATNVDGVSEILGEEKPCGLVVEAEDYVALGKAMLTLCSDQKREEFKHTVNLRRIEILNESQKLESLLSAIYGY